MCTVDIIYVRRMPCLSTDHRCRIRGRGLTKAACDHTVRTKSNNRITNGKCLVGLQSGERLDRLQPPAKQGGVQACRSNLISVPWFKRICDMNPDKACYSIGQNMYKLLLFENKHHIWISHAYIALIKELRL